MARKIGVNSNLKLYKFIPFKYIKKIIKDSYMPIKRIDEWEDCYENYFLKNEFVMGVDKYNLREVSRKFYGLCFSVLEESDALWRIYSDVKGLNTTRTAYDNVAIRVCVKPEQLYQLVPVSDNVNGGTYIQRVRYISKAEMEFEILSANHICLNSIGEEITKSLFTKRKEFSHEKEVRYIFVTNKYHNAKSINMSLNPVAFFDEFVIDPRLNKKQYCDIKRELENIGVASSKIKQSSLYRFETKTLTIIP